jgi:hypothetical protein
MLSFSRPRIPQGTNFVINTSTEKTENNGPFISLIKERQAHEKKHGDKNSL